MQTFYSELLARFEELHADIEKTLAGLSAEALDWSPGPEMNSLSVIVAHATGVERYLVCQLACGQVIQRDREAEFKVRGLDEATLKNLLADSRAQMRAALESVELGQVVAPRTRRDGQPTTVAWALLHALDHTAQHLGHMQITRQLWDQERG